MQSYSFNAIAIPLDANRRNGPISAHIFEGSVELELRQTIQVEFSNST